MLRPLAGWCVAGASLEDREVSVQPIEDLGRGQEAHLRGRQLDGQRKAIDTLDDPRDGRDIVSGGIEGFMHGSGALEEQR
jgi:hypothetical protein